MSNRKKISKCISIRTCPVTHFNGSKKYVSTGDSDDFDNAEIITFQNRPSRANLQPLKNDVLFAKMKKTNKVILIDEKTKDMIFSTGFFAINPLLNFPRYIYYLFQSDEFNQEKDSLSFGTTQEALNERRFKQINTSFISNYNEQQVIATYLDEQVSRLDQLIQDQQQVIEDWKAYKQSLITETVTKGLNPEVEMKDSGVEWMGKIPSHWRVKKSKYLINFRTGLSITKKDFVELGYKTINYGQIHSKYTFDLDLTRDDLFKINFDYAQLNPSTILKEGDFVFCDTSEDLNGCGNCVLVENTNKEVLLAGSHTTIGKLKGDSVPRYMAYLFKSDKFREQIRSNVVGTKVFSITQRILKNTFLIIPPLHEQQQIADFLDEKCSKIDQLIEDKQRLIEDLKAYKQSLIYECVTGKKEIV